MVTSRYQLECHSLGYRRSGLGGGQGWGEEETTGSMWDMVSVRGLWYTREELSKSSWQSDLHNFAVMG